MSYNLWRATLIAVLILSLAAPARAESLDTARNQLIVGIVVVSAGITILVIYLVKHHNKAKITGCIISGANGMSLTEEKDKRTYALSGDPVGVKAGNRMTLEGKRKNNTFEARSVTHDFGACTP